MYTWANSLTIKPTAYQQLGSLLQNFEGRKTNFVKINFLPYFPLELIKFVMIFTTSEIV